METAAMWKPRKAGLHPPPHLPAVSTTLGKPASTPSRGFTTVPTTPTTTRGERKRHRRKEGSATEPCGLLEP